MGKTDIKELNRIRRHRRLRKKVMGTSEKPRISIHRSSANLYAQAIDDLNGKTLVNAATTQKGFKEKTTSGGNVKAAAILGEVFAKAAKAKGIEKVVFDRSGYIFHGRIKAFAEAARKNGLVF
ncbi:MAG: 50S ribosomal protein L18 [Candidatus Omnitrophica bacterium]|nr:50S ribosomal protein L18 [Candidatus Omnitrophota bacterium]